MDYKNTYHTFCQSEKSLPIFFQDWFLDAVCGKDNWNVILLEKSGKVAAVLPFYLKSKAGFKYITMPPLTKFSGPYIIDEFKYKSQSIYKELIIKLPKVDHYIQNFHYTVDNWLPFYWEKYQQQTLYSYIITNFKDEKHYFSSIDRYYKKKINLAKELLVIKTHSEIKNSISQSFVLIEKTFQRQKLTIPFTKKLYSSLIQSLLSEKKVKLFFALNKEDKVIATAILVWDNTSAYYLISGDDPEYRTLAAGIYLTYKMIRYTTDVLELDKFDFLGSMIPSLEIMRRKFSAKAEPYFEIQKTNSNAFNLLSKLKNI